MIGGGWLGGENAAKQCKLFGLDQLKQEDSCVLFPFHL
jgi:hypothetical protein